MRWTSCSGWMTTFVGREMIFPVLSPPRTSSTLPSKVFRKSGERPGDNTAKMSPVLRSLYRMAHSLRLDSAHLIQNDGLVKYLFLFADVRRYNCIQLIPFIFTMKKTFIVIAIILVLALLPLLGTYNSIVALNQDTAAKWSQVEGQYQRRMDLIPNLVATVKGAANFEQTTLTAVVEARAKATQVTVDPSKLDAESIAKYQAAQGELSSALGKLLMITENYPTLTATENFKDLQSQIEGTENRIAVSRKDFGDSVQTYNTKVSQFPGNIVAKLFGFAPKAYFKADQSAAAAPSVAF